MTVSHIAFSIRAPSKRYRLEGRIDEVAFYGTASHLQLENATAVPLSVTIRNQARTAPPTAPKGPSAMSCGCRGTPPIPWC